MEEGLNKTLIDRLEGIISKFENQLFRFELDTNCDNPMQVILKGHLYIEHEMRTILERNIKNSNIMDIDRLKFTELSKIIFSFDLVPIEVYPPIKYINQIRNQYSHNLNFIFSEDNLNELLKTFSLAIQKRFNIFMSSRNNSCNTVAKLQLAIFTIWAVLVDISMIPDDIKMKLHEDFKMEGKS